MKTRSPTILLGAAFLLVVGFILVSQCVVAPRAAQVEARNKDALAYIEAMTRLTSSNAAVRHFSMNLIRAGLQDGTIDVRVTLASANYEAEVMRLFHSQRAPYAVGGAVAFDDSTNAHRISIVPGER